MAGSYGHVTNRADASFSGLDLIDNLGDAYEAIEEMHLMIAYLARQANPTEPKRAIHEAWLEGCLRPLAPGNADDPNLASYESFWDPNG